MKRRNKEREIEIKEKWVKDDKKVKECKMKEGSKGKTENKENNSDRWTREKERLKRKDKWKE